MRLSTLSCRWHEMATMMDVFMIHMHCDRLGVPPSTSFIYSLFWCIAVLIYRWCHPYLFYSDIILVVAVIIYRWCQPYLFYSNIILVCSCALL